MFSVRRAGWALATAVALSNPALASTTLINGLGMHTAGGNAQLEVVDGADVMIDAFEQSNVKVSGGYISVLGLRDAASADISGGTIGHLMLNDNSVARLTSVTSLSWILFDGPNSRAEVFSNDAKYAGGRLSGTWYDGTTFSFWAIPEGGLSPDPYIPMPANIVITSVPEPAQWLLLSLGMSLIYLRSRQRRAG